jgi:hypothetical protein
MTKSIATSARQVEGTIASANNTCNNLLKGRLSRGGKPYSESPWVSGVEAFGVLCQYERGAPSAVRSGSALKKEELVDSRLCPYGI